MPRIVTVDKMVNVIRESDRPALTKKEIAEGIGVSWQAIDNHEAELEDDPRVEHGKIGQATTYWLAPGQSDADSASEQRGEDEIDEELLTAGGAPADGQYGDLIEVMNELRSSHAETQAKIEHMEEELARAQHQDDQQSEDTAEDTAELVDRQIQKHEHTTRVNDAADRGVVTFISGIVFSLWGQSLGGGETVTTIAGVLLIYAFYQFVKYLYLRVQGAETDESSTSEEPPSAANSGAGAR